MESHSSLTELVHNLDATTYFFVTSGLFVGIVALVFFILGLWFGGLLWRRYKRRCRTAEATIESLKNEAAQLKRRIAGQSARVQSSSSGSSASLGLAESMSESIPPITEVGQESDVELPLPPGQPFTLWTLPSEEPTHAPASTRFTAPLLFPSQPPALVFPPSRAFCIWTEEDWQPPNATAPTPGPLLFAPNAAFTLWTVEASHPPRVPVAWPPSAAFTLWTQEISTPAPVPAPPATPIPSPDALIATATAVRSIASRLPSPPPEPQVTVSFPEEQEPWTPSLPSFRSHAFTLWTQTAGSGSSTQSGSGSGISQRATLASLIRSRVESSPPPLPPLPPLDMEPLPFVPAAEVDSHGS